MKKIIAYKDYFLEFYDSLSQDEKDKLDRVLVLLHSENKMPAHYIKPLTDGIYELRLTTLNKELRILFMYDSNSLIVLLNCFIKKTRKTPRSIIDRAKLLKKMYYEEVRK